jgi:cytochrome c
MPAALRLLTACTLFLAVGMAPSRLPAQEALTRSVLSQADYVVGRRAFQMRCSACHTLADKGSDLTGPNLWGVIGAKAGTRGAFQYSEALKASGITWNADRLDAFLADRGPIPRIRMAIPRPCRIRIAWR